ncbi:glycosyltransferase [Streptomyces pathocidini]|uniref:D-inositol 3-phosphate glycosyltransferase n=1 Tax=Streptomyces pathocidini TaxID=1650571 RepID=A0ABW7URX3_9ACTN|nr:glycosyltransferase [Streptomyces pathocidini]
MKVLHVVTLHTPDNAFGGPTRVALNLSKSLRDKGIRAALVALGDGFAPHEPLPTRVEGVPARLHRARHALPRYEVSGITSVRLLAGARRLVAAADVVHVHLMRDLVTLPVALAALARRRPLVVQTHGMIDPTEKRPARIVDALGVRRVLREADAVLTLTEGERRNVDAVAGRPGLVRHARLVNGVRLQEHRPRTADGPPTILYLARVQEGKRPQDFVAAMPTVLAEHPDARFVLAGPDTGALAGTLARARALGVDGSLAAVGPLDSGQVMEQLRRADVYVLPSIQDAFSVSVLEALSVGTPVVVTRTTGLAPDVERAGAGRVVDSREGDAGNGPRIGRAVLELLDPAAHAEASAAAHRLVREEFTLDAVTDTLRGVYEQVVTGRAR